jgi:hypothetical protein
VLKFKKKFSRQRVNIRKHNGDDKPEDQFLPLCNGMFINVIVLVRFLIVGGDKIFCGSDASNIHVQPRNQPRKVTRQEICAKRKWTSLLRRTISVYEACSGNAKTLSCKLAVRRLVLRGKNFAWMDVWGFNPERLSSDRKKDSSNTVKTEGENHFG